MKNKTEDCEHGFNGDCCCNCQNFVEITCHPMNKKVGKGSITKALGFGCEARFGDEPKDEMHKITFMDREHGMCECHIRNK